MSEFQRWINWCKQLFSDKVFVCLIFFTVFLAGFWFCSVHRYVSPLWVGDEWCWGKLWNGNITQIFNDLWGFQNEQSAPWVGVINRLLSMCHVPYWYYPFISVIVNLFAVIFTVIVLHEFRGYSSYCDFAIPLLLFHPSLVFAFLRIDMPPFFWAMSFATMVVTLILFGNKVMPKWNNILIGILLIILPLNTAGGVIFAITLGTVYLITCVIGKIQEKRTIIISVCSLLVMGCFVSAYLYHMKLGSVTQEALQTSSTNKSVNIIHTIGATFGDMGLHNDWLCFAILLSLLVLGIVVLFVNYFQKKFSFIEVLMLAGIVASGFAVPFVLGIVRTGSAAAGARHMPLLLMTPITMLFAWNYLTIKLQKLSIIPALILGISAISFLYSFNAVTDTHGIQKISHYWSMKEDIDAGLPLEVIASRNGYEVYWASSKNFIGSLKQKVKYQEHLFANLKTWNELYPDSKVTQLSSESFIPLDMTKKSSTYFMGNGKLNATMECKFPAERYVRAIKIQYALKADKFGIATGAFPYVYISTIGKDIDKNTIGIKNLVNTSIKGDSNECWIWVDSVIDRFYLTPNCEQFQLEMESVYLYD